ncbi:regulator [Denitrobaculum tricleocarpae]|uniref:Regulator n=1 Tax=Denitrobaculum tricleocarpae TaxID=2591009 RepID=A0A545TB78_9PROT|nr:regulator [Denitrobaculum tricleocarpae]TQV74469.1 regulator [Denitrobaculum tricleocarpae]
MSTVAAADYAPMGFDDSNIKWFPLGDFKHFVFAVLDVDNDRRIVDAVLKYEPSQKIFMHRHIQQTNTLVLQGEHRLYEPDGTLKDVRPVGRYTATPADPDPHTEGGGAEGAIVLYSIRADGDLLFEILDDKLEVVGTLTMQDLNGAFEMQRSA